MANVKTPKETGRRDPLTNEKRNGAMYNPPRYEEAGGFDSAARYPTKSRFNIKPVGNGR